MVTLFAILIMIFLAVEIGYNTHVELKVGAAQVDRLKAFYLAKAGVQLSLLRISAYNVVSTKFGAQLGPQKSDLDLIWKFPFAWPPLVPDEISGVDKAQIKEIVKKSTIDGAFSTSIETESGKIDINDLDSPSPAVQKAVNAELVQILTNRMNAEDDWAQNHRNLRPQEIINNIADWIDEDDNSRNGGSEASYYTDTNPPIKPPNRSIKTLEELHMVAGVTDDVYRVLVPNLTLWGDKSINVNQASKIVLRSIDVQITDQIADAIIERRTDESKGGPFTSADFNNFLQSQGVNLSTFNKPNTVPLTYDSVTNFKIKSTGVFGKATREIIAIVYDFGKVKSELQTSMGSPSASPSPGPSPVGPTPVGSPGASPSPSPTPASSSTGVPQIVFWQEF